MIAKIRSWLLMGSLAGLVTLPAVGQEVQLARNEKAAEQAVAALILTEVYQKAGLTPVIQPLPGVRATAMALAGEVDGEVARIASYATNNPTLIRVEPGYYFLASTVFAKDGSKVVVHGRDDLKKYRVGVVRGIAHAKAATEGVAAVEEVATYQQMYQMLDAGRIDVAVDTDINGAYMTRKMALTDVKPVAQLARLELFHILTPKSRALAPRIAAVLKSFKERGELEKMAFKYEQAFLKSGVEP